MASFQQVRFREESPVGLVGGGGGSVRLARRRRAGSRKTSTPSATWRDQSMTAPVISDSTASCRSSTPVRLRVENGSTSRLACRLASSGSCATGAHGLPRLLAAELVRLGHHDDQRDVRRRPAEQLAVEVGELAADVDHQHDAGEGTPLADVVAGERLPGSLGARGCSREAVSGRIDQEAERACGRLAIRAGWSRRADGEQVERLRPAGRATGKSQPTAVADQVDAGRLAGIGAADESDLGQTVRVGLRELGEPHDGVG